MKIKEEIKKSGTFWIPQSPEPVPGVLSISNEKGIVLEVAKSLINDPTSIVSSFINLDNVFQVIGHIQEYGFVIFDGCQTSTSGLNFNLSQIQTSQVIWANRVFTGFPYIQYLQNGIPPFNTFKFSIEGIDDWVGISGISTINARYRRAGGTTTISYKLPETISFNLTEGMQLEVVFTARRPDSLNPTDVGVAEKTFFRLVSKDPQDFKTFVSIAQKITDLLCFAINETVSLDSMSAASDALSHNIGDNITVPAEINIYDLSLSYSKDQPQISQDRMLFKFGEIRVDAEQVINKWLENYKQYEHALNLYFLAQLRSQPSPITKFLSLAQCLEVYHRKTPAFGNKYMEDDEFKPIRKSLIKQFPKGGRNWFGAKLQHANEFSLRDRIREIIKPFEGFIGEEKVPQLIDYIVDSRHYYTHYNPELEPKAAKGWDLYILCEKMEMLFELRFLELMGFGEEKINSVKRLREKCELPFSDA